MKPIYPIREEQCREHYGKPVVIYLKDGSELYGVLSRCENGTIILNDEPDAAATTQGKKNKATVKAAANSRKGKKPLPSEASTSAFGFGGYPYPYPPFNPYGGRIVLDLALIALLFALV